MHKKKELLKNSYLTQKGIVNSDNGDNSNNTDHGDGDDFIQFKLLYRHFPVPTPFPVVTLPLSLRTLGPVWCL